MTDHLWRKDRLLGRYCKRCGLADTHPEAKDFPCKQQEHPIRASLELHVAAAIDRIESATEESVDLEQLRQEFPGHDDVAEALNALLDQGVIKHDGEGYGIASEANQYVAIVRLHLNGGGRDSSRDVTNDDAGGPSVPDFPKAVKVCSHDLTLQNANARGVCATCVHEADHVRGAHAGLKEQGCPTCNIAEKT